MILIYNLPGLLVGIVGVAVGLVVALASGMLSLGVLALAAVWFGLGLWWRNSLAQDGVKRPYPALFFIPLPILAIPLALASLPLLLAEKGASRRAVDPRAALLRADEKALDAARLGGEIALSRRIADALESGPIEEAKADDCHIFTRTGPGAVLVLVKAPNLRKYKETTRIRLLGAIAEAVSAGGQAEGRRIYIGVKGRVAFGAIRVPPDRVKTGAVVDPSPLYDFYGEKPATPAKAA
jgi:hypothetical protein